MSLQELKQNHIMAHLTKALNEGQDIGHDGRLVYAIVARHFLDEDDLVGQLARDRDFSEAQVRDLVHQVQEADYNPPRRETILEYMGKQDFPILPHAGDPDEGSVYRDLEFPEHVYSSIQEYHHEKAEAD